MSLERFPDSRLAVAGDIEFELVDREAFRHGAQLESLREEVLEIAATSRGWTERDHLEWFRRSFKIGPLYETNALALARRSGRLVGIAGAVNEWHVPEGSIVHLCSLGLLPGVQGRGVLPALMLLLWRVTLLDPVASLRHRQRRLFVSAITQSPYILHFMSRLASIYPSPDRDAPEPEETSIARRVVERFDAHLALDDTGFVLRKECEFRYRRLPLSPDRRLNRFCTERLNYDEGDVFVVVGRVEPEKMAAFARQVTSTHAELVARFESALPCSEAPRA